jgi:molybdate transport system regulatory protein
LVPNNRSFQKKIYKTTCLPRVRVIAGEQIALGPGKVNLLEEIDRSGSISKAARELGLSYRRAWTLVDTMNKSFKSPLVEGSAGGKKGGGAHLTHLGKKIAKTYRGMESKAEIAMKSDWEMIRSSLKPID